MSINAGAWYWLRHAWEWWLAKRSYNHFGLEDASEWCSYNLRRAIRNAIVEVCKFNLV